MTKYEDVDLKRRSKKENELKRSGPNFLDILGLGHNHTDDDIPLKRPTSNKKVS